MAHTTTERRLRRTVIFTYVVDISWENNGKYISYNRVEMLGDAFTKTTDAEYESVKNVSIASILGKLYKKGEEYWLDWSDENYSYDIDSEGVNNPEITLKRMAESIYQKK